VILLDATPKARELNDQVAARCPFCHAGHEAVVIMAEVGEYPPPDGPKGPSRDGTDRPKGAPMIDITRPFECPFCNFDGESVIKYMTATPGSFVKCVKCGAKGPDATNEAEAVRLWNLAPRRSDGLGKRT
jgi:hypothetical protein